MSQLTNHGENKLADFVRGQGLTLPASWYVALGTAASDSIFAEVTGTGYGRIAVPRSLTAWSGTQGTGTTLPSTGGSHTTSNNDAIDFGTAGSAWGSASHLGLFDDPTIGNCWVWLELDAPLAIGNGDPVALAAGSVMLTLGYDGGMSDYLSNKLIDLLFRAEAYAWPATLYAALYTAPPNNAGGGTEVASGSYARASIASSMAAWSGTQAAGSTIASSGIAGRISNNAALTYPVPTGTWGTVGHEGLLDAATLGNLMWWRALASPKSIQAGGSAPSHPANTMGITFA